MIIDNLGFFGIGNYSRNKKYFVAGTGSKLVLIDCEEKRIKYIKESFRSIMFPHPVPTNEGYVELFDSPTNELFSIYYIISLDGNIIVKQSVNALIQNSSISTDNSFACFQTANNPEHEDGNKLFIVDVKKNQILYKWFVPTYWADSYEIDTIKQKLVLKYEDGRHYQYDFIGNLLDKEVWRKDRLKFANGYQLINEANEAYEIISNSKDKNSLQAYDEIIQLIQAAVTMDITNYQKSIAYRKLGEIYLQFDYKQEALDTYELALSFNPKIGLKREITRLKKEIE